MAAQMDAMNRIFTELRAKYAYAPHISARSCALSNPRVFRNEETRLRASIEFEQYLAISLRGKLSS